MERHDLRSLSELVDIAKRRLADGAADGEARAVLPIEGRDVVCIRASWKAGHSLGEPVVTHLLNGYPVRPQALRLMIAIHGATLLPQRVGDVA